jgi:hypothetical protein
MRLVGLLVVPLLLATAQADEVDFVRDVVPALTKSGCNAGACHGSFQGRGGLRLSLLGFDPAADYRALAQEARGRRVFPAAPESSLLLRKATLAMPHGGGQRMTPESPAYRLLVTWIEQGLPPPRSDLRLTAVQVTPTELLLKSSGAEAQLKLTATWSDGIVRDVTAWAQYELREQEIAEVSPAGLVRATGPGRVAVTIRYLDQVLAVPTSVPFGEQRPFEFVRQNQVDDLLASEWQKLGLVPGPLANDAEFLRRTSLDLIGTLPTVEETRRFLADTRPDKRSKLIDELLQRPEYVDYWSLKWSDLLRAHRRALGEKGLASFHGWLKQRMRENAGFDAIVRELIAAEGNLFTRGPVAYYFVDRTPEDLAETTAQLFLGVRLTCARCHHHPFEIWGQDDYYSLASFFTGVVRKDNREGGAYGGAQAIRMQAGPPMRHPNSGVELPPRALGWTPPVLEAGSDVRKPLAQWLTRPDNERFAKTVVNRYWAAMFGRGLVHPVDDLSTSNPPVFPAVLDALSQDFVAHKYDLKHLLRTICNSRAYQLAGDPHTTSDREGKYFIHRTPLRLPAEVLLDAMNQSAGMFEAFTGLPEGTRAIALPDSNVDSYFLTTFGRPRRTSTCDCERMSRLDLAQVLHLANGEKLQAKLSAPEGRIAGLVKSGKPDGELVDELYLATLTRLPAADERGTALKFLAGVPNRQEALEDVLWALLNCPEFVMNH